MIATPSPRQFDRRHSSENNTIPLSQAPQMVRLASSSILTNSTQSFSAFSPTPPPASGQCTPRPGPQSRSTTNGSGAGGAMCSFAPTQPARANSLGQEPGSSSLLQRRRSSNAGARGGRPNMSMALGLGSLKLDPPVLPNDLNDDIREHVIGISAAEDFVGSPKSDPGTPGGRFKGVVERSFKGVRERHPTPFPERKPSFLDESDEDDGEEAGDSDEDEEESSTAEGRRDDDPFLETGVVLPVKRSQDARIDVWGPLRAKVVFLVLEPGLQSKRACDPLSQYWSRDVQARRGNEDDELVVEAVNKRQDKVVCRKAKLRESLLNNRRSKQGLRHLSRSILTSAQHLNLPPSRRMSYNPSANPYGPQGLASRAPPVAGPAYAGPSYPAYSGAESYGAEPAGGDYDASLAYQQQSAYTPDAARAGGYSNPAGKGKARTTVLRKGGGTIWEDQSLIEWDPAHFRLFVGDLDPALSDTLFHDAFAKWPSFVKAKIVRDKTNKGKGYGFASYSDPEDMLKAWKAMNGQYVGTRPVKISRATSTVASVNIGDRKAKLYDAKVQKKGGTVAFSRAKLAEAEGGGLNRAGGGFGPERSRKSYIRR
ncbi:RNA-binding protein 42, partial [Phenoliferia sp. Uapishka_3]